MPEDAGDRPIELPELHAQLLRHRAALFAFFRLNAGQLVLGREECSDLVQTVFRELLAAHPGLRLRSDEQFRQLVFTTARNKLHDRKRYLKRQRRDPAREVAMPPLGETPHEELLTRAYRTVFTPSENAMAREELRRFEDAFARLPPQWREVVSLHRIAGMTYEAIAAARGKTADAVRMQVQRALARLALLLEEGESAR